MNADTIVPGTDKIAYQMVFRTEIPNCGSVQHRDEVTQAGERPGPETIPVRERQNEGERRAGRA